MDDLDDDDIRSEDIDALLGRERDEDDEDFDELDEVVGKDDRVDEVIRGEDGDGEEEVVAIVQDAPARFARR